jgi:hypothetical protein
MFKVMPNKTVGKRGQRFVARGVQMFDYLFVSFESDRLNYNFRRIYEPAHTYPNANVSEPTYYARIQYVSEQNVRDELTNAANVGVNLIRVNIEPAIRYATLSYVDPVNGLTYPCDLTMLDQIIAIATEYEMVVQLQNSNDTGSVGENTTFLSWLADRYKNAPYVWINPANEIYGYSNGAANVLNVSMWETAQQSYVSAIRAAGFKNPICLDPPGWAERLDLIVGVLNTNPTFKNDDNLIIQPHYYPAQGQNDFRSDKLPAVNSMWFQYVNQFCILVGEAGIDNLPGRLDPNIDPAIGSVNLTDWGNAQAAALDFVKWANEQTLFTAFNGVIGHMWKSYLPYINGHDDNTMRRQNGTWTTWGLIFRNNFLSPPVFNLSQIVTGIPALLGPKMGNGSVGTPDFQAEGKAGVRAAGAFIAPNASSPIIAFFRRDNGAMIGSIAGNGSGINYGTTSDYRLKQDVSAINDDELISMIELLNPVMATWTETGVREPMFIAHEVQQVLPNAVIGEKDGAVYQSVDYAKLVPLLLAAVKYLINERKID